MQTLSFELENSLMDRFIAIYLNNSDKGISKWINNGLDGEVNNALLQDRAEWFGRDAVDIKWNIDASENLQREIREAIYLVFSILGKDAEEERYKGVSVLFNDIVRLSVVQGHSITTYTKYKTCISSADLALQYMLYKLGYVEYVTYQYTNYSNQEKRGRSLQLKGMQPKKGGNGKLEDISFKDVADFISKRINNKGVSILLNQLKKVRNKESHAAFYTNPDKYWNRLVYMLYDYIAIAFFLMRYFRDVNDGTIDAVEHEDLKAVNQAVINAESLIKEAENIHVRFQFVQNKTKEEKLSVKAVGGDQIGDQIQDLRLLTEDDNTFCYYDKILNRNATYHLQSVEFVDGEYTLCGTELALNTELLFDGAVINLKMPTENVTCPTIESIIAKSTGLIEDSENRAVIEGLLENIDDDAFRNKLRVILMLDKGDKELIIKEFVGREEDTPEDFKTFIENRSGEILGTIERRFDALNNSLQTNQEDLKEFISNAILKSILASNAEIQSDLHSLNDEIKKWQELQQKIEKQDANEARNMYECLKNGLEKSNQTIGNLCEIFKSQNSQWDEVLSELRVIGADVKSVKENQERAEQERNEAERKRKIRKIVLASVGALCSIVLALTICSCYILSTSSNAFIYNSEWRSELAHGWFKNKDVAYERAKYLESKKEYSDAAKWYMLARDRYSDILSKTSSDSIRALRMTQMLMRGKGGSFDTKRAESYAKIAKRFDIEAYLAAVNGNPGKAVTLSNSQYEKPTAYSELANAMAYLLYPHNNWDKNIFYASGATIFSLAENENIAQQEALQICYRIVNCGLKENEGWTCKWNIQPSLMDAICAAEKADKLYNDIYAQLFLSMKFYQLGLTDKGDYYKSKLVENGFKALIALEDDEISEFREDPASLICYANRNLKNGPINYAETGYLYHLADSIMSTSCLGIRFRSDFYEDWMECALKAEDLTSVESIMPLITKSLPDSLRLAAAEYVMAMKHMGGYSVEIDTLKSYEYLQSAASKGLIDAKVSYSILQDLQGNHEAFESLIEFVLTNPDKTKIPAVRYIMSKLGIGEVNTLSEPYSKLWFYMDLDSEIMSRFLSSVSLDNLMEFDKDELLATCTQINWAIANTPSSNYTAYLLSKLSMISLLLNEPNISEWYGTLAMKINPNECYATIFDLSELYRKMDNYKAAHKNASDFFNVFFSGNSVGIDVLDESNIDNVIQHFYQLYPDILEEAKKEYNYDFTQGRYWFVEVDKNNRELFSTYKSPVNNLHIDFPKYEFSFPVTMKYFD